MSLVKFKLYGELGKFIGSEEWELDVSSVQEGIQALNSITKNKFNDYFILNNKLKAKYRVIINGRDFLCEEKELNESNWEKFTESELVMKKNDLQTVDIVPLIESSSGVINAILGVLLIIVGAILAFIPGAQGLGYGLIVAGLSLLANGIIALLSKPPTFNYNQSNSNSVSQSYLFNSPQNTVGEGGPVPVGYGTMLLGSNVISAGYLINEFQTFRS